MPFLKLPIKAILENPLGHVWSLQGLGMLRLYLSKEVRLHVWSDHARVDEVSELHDHPWSFMSWIIAGKLKNTRFTKCDGGGDRYMCQSLLCGTGGGLKGGPVPMQLSASRIEHYMEGDAYFQDAPEIHRSEPEDGTVTIIERRFSDDVDHARVFWEEGKPWVSAEPRVATDSEVLHITRNALQRWF